MNQRRSRRGVGTSSSSGVRPLSEMASSLRGTISQALVEQIDIALSPPLGHRLDLATKPGTAGTRRFCVADTTDRFVEAITELQAVADEVTPDDAAKSFDDRTLQNLWRA